MRRYFQLWLLFGMLGFAILGQACTSSAGPPSPLAEIPSLVQFPESISIDVSQASGGSAGVAAGNAVLLKFQTAVTDFSDIISLGPIVFNVTNNQLDLFLGPLADVDVPVSPSVTTFEGPITFAPEVVGLVKIDFSDFDLDGDGATEGCTGCTCPTGCAPEIAECPAQVLPQALHPVCYRIWLRDVGQTEFVRFAAGRIDRYATRDNPNTKEDEQNAGNGAFRMHVETISSERTRNPIFFGANYQHRDDQDPAMEATELFVQDRTFDSTNVQTEFVNFHAVVTQQTPQANLPPENLKKDVKLDFRTLPDPADQPGIVQYIGSFLDGFDFWSGTFNLQDVDASKQVSGEDVCASISTGLEAPRQNCLDLGIDVSGQAFIRPAEESDVSFPENFPLVPTF